MSAPVVWITGAGGFIGAHLAAHWRGRGATVVGFGRPGAGPGLTPLTAEGLAQAQAAHGAPVRVFHLAGGSTVGRSLADPLGDFHSNVTTTATLLDAVRRLAPEAPVTVASSAAVYGAADDRPLGVDRPLAPVSPYGHNKAMAERLCQSHAQCFALRVTVLRLFSIYGAGLRKQLVHDLCTRLAKGESPLVLGGTGRELRDWCHVDDAVAGIADAPAAEAGTVATYNLGTGQGTDVATVAGIIAAAWGEGRAPAFTGQTRPGDPFSLVAAPDSLPPGFAPRVPLAQGLAEAVHHFRAAPEARA